MLWHESGVQPPSSLDHDPLAAVFVTVIIMIAAAAVMLLVAVGVELLVYAVQPQRKPLLFRHVVRWLRAEARK